MKGKYDSLVRFLGAVLVRQMTRRKVGKLVRWEHQRGQLHDGVTVVVGMCHRLPDVIQANMRCLVRNAWPDLKEIIVVVDAEKGSVDSELVETVKAIAAPIETRFMYYSAEQADVTEKLKLPYVFAWLSWSIGIANARYKYLFLHDYDALILDDHLGARFETFLQENLKVQGVSWYNTNGFLDSDGLSTTFETFVDLDWLLRFQPLDFFTRVGVHNGRTCDFDILLELQAKHLSPDQRSIVEPPGTSLVHPAQMIHQYTMSRKNPGVPDNCYSLPMIPFFGWLSGNCEELANAIGRIACGMRDSVDFFGDGVSANFSYLSVEQVDWALKQMVQVCVSMGIERNTDLLDYGTSLYELAEVPAEQHWVGDFSKEQREWIGF